MSNEFPWNLLCMYALYRAVSGVIFIAFAQRLRIKFKFTVCQTEILILLTKYFLTTIFTIFYFFNLNETWWQEAASIGVHCVKISKRSSKMYIYKFKILLPRPPFFAKFENYFCQLWPTSWPIGFYSIIMKFAWQLDLCTDSIV